VHHIDLPAGSAIRLTATAGPKVGLHRWGMRLFAAHDPQPNAPARPTYGSQIGEGDCEQRIDVPAQDRDCRVEVNCARAATGRWQDQQGSVEHDTPGLLVVQFADTSASEALTDDVVLSFAISGSTQLGATE
jgi:hypothetical protein